MSHSLSNSTGSFPASSNRKLPREIIDERETIWLDMGPYDEMIWKYIRTLVGPGINCDIDILTDNVKDEFQKEFRASKHLPSTERGIRAYLLRKALWRAMTYLELENSSLRKNIQLHQIDENGEEYDLEIPDVEAEEAFLYIEAMLDNRSAIKLLEQGLDRLTDIERICLIMCRRIGMKPRQIVAQLAKVGIEITAEQVSSHVAHAHRKMRTFFGNSSMEQLWIT